MNLIIYPLFFIQCYFDPFTGRRFYSKGEVLRHLNAVGSGKFKSKKKKPPGVKPEEKYLCKSASDQKSISVVFRDDVCHFRSLASLLVTDFLLVRSSDLFSLCLIQGMVETSPDGLRPSCIKQVNCRGNASRLGKDLVFTDFTFS